MRVSAAVPVLGSALEQLPAGRAAAVFVATAAVLAAIVVRPPGTRVLSGRLSVSPSGDRPPRGGAGRPADRDEPGRDRAGTDRMGTGRAGADHGAARPVAVGRAARVVRAVAVSVAAVGVVLAAGADVGAGARSVTSVLGRSGLLGASPALAVVVVVSARARMRNRRRRLEVAARASLIRGTEALLADLRAGSSSLDALGAAAAEVPELGPVAAAARLGGDVPAALSGLAGRPGLAGLGHLAAAWAVSQETGSSLTGTLDRLVDALRDAEEVRQETDVSLATPRATARLLAALPAAGLGLGTLVGADPWGFLTGSAAGAAIAAIGALLAGIGLEWVEALADRVQRVGGGDPTDTSDRGAAVGSAG